MIAKISKGKGFRGCLDYVIGKDGAKIIAGNMGGENARELAAEFGQVRKLRTDIKNAVFHVALSLPAGENLKNGEWDVVANKYLARMGFSPLEHQFVAVMHADTDYQHIHVVASRIGLDGQVADVWQDQKRSKDICRELEREHGLTIISNGEKTHRAKTTQKERRMITREKRDSEKTFVANAIKVVLESGSPMSAQTFCDGLQVQGVVAVPAIASTGKVQGFSFQHGLRSYTGAQVGYAWKYLQPSLAAISAQDTAYLQARKARLQQGTPVEAIRSIKNAVWEVAVRGVSFDKALAAQGWALRAGGTMEKNGRTFEVSDLVDTKALDTILHQLRAVTKNAREQARERCRELAKQKSWSPRQAFMREACQADVLFVLFMFPQVAVFLVVLSALSTLVRGKNFKMQMGDVWKVANDQVNAAIRDVQKEMVRSARDPRGDAANRFEPEKIGREHGGADEGDSGNGKKMGTSAGREVGADAKSAGKHAGVGAEIALATEDVDRDGFGGLPGRGGVAVAGPVPAGNKQCDGTSVTVDAVTEWANLAENLAVLTGGGKMEGVKTKTASVAYKEQVWDRQHSALMAPSYRVTVRGRGAEDGKTINLCKRKDGTEATWTADGVKNKIKTLEYWNARGFDIYITPIDDNYHHLLLDDLTAEGVTYINRNYNVCLVQTSSANNFQAIIRVPKTEISEKEQSAANELLRRLNHLPDGCGGDKSISAPRHPFRVVGFFNKKPAKNNVQTKIEYLSPDTVCGAATAELEEIRLARVKETIKCEYKDNKDKKETTIRLGDFAAAGSAEADRDFAREWDRVHGWATGKVAAGVWTDVDRSAVDYRVCKKMLDDGYSVAEVAGALVRQSPGLASRHGDVEGYVTRTVAAAGGHGDVWEQDVDAETEMDMER